MEFKLFSKHEADPNTENRATQNICYDFIAVNQKF